MNIHLHMLCLGGVYTRRPDGGLRFRRVKAPAREEPEVLVQCIAERVGRTLRVPILNDGQTEPAESFRVVLANPSAGMGLDECSIAEVTIADNDVGVHFATAELRSEEHGGPVYLTVIRGSDGTEPIAVEYATIDGTAIGGVDYVAAAGLITFGPGEVSKSIAIEILRLIKTFESFEYGSNKIMWNTNRNKNGELSSGVYFFIIRTKENLYSKKLLLLE